MARSYNSVGAGETPKLGGCDFVEGKARTGGHGGHNIGAVTVNVDIPRVARPGGATGGGLHSSGDPLPAARPGGAQGVTHSSSAKSGSHSSDY